MYMRINPDNKMLRYQFDSLQGVIGEGNARRGFHEEGDALRTAADNSSRGTKPHANLRNYYMAKIGLIMSEGAEALEELRSGRLADETYYPSETKGLSIPELRKPEGVPSEIADIVIRAFDFADEAGFSLIDVILEKLAYNDTRAHMHGRQV